MKEIKLHCEFTASLSVPDSEVCGKNAYELNNDLYAYVDDVLDGGFNKSEIELFTITEVSNVG